MDTSSFDEQIDEQDKRIEALLGDMDATAQDYMNATVGGLSKSFDATTNEAVTGNPEQAKRLGVAGLSGLKNELRDLRAQIPDFVRALDNPSVWVHKPWPKGHDPAGRKILRYESPSGDSSRYVGDMSYEVAQLTAPLIELLGKHGFYVKRVHALPPTLYMPSWTPEMRDALNRYRQQADQLDKLRAGRKKIEDQKAMAVAADMWEQA